MASKVKGLDRLLRQISALPDAALQETAAEVDAGAEDLAQRIRAHAPRTSKEHQHMADGIKAVPADGGGKSKSGILAAAGLAMKVIAPFPARFVEFGTKFHPPGGYRDDRGHKRHAGRGHHATRAHPFFWPTVRAWKKPMRSRIRKAFVAAAKRAAGL